VSRLDLDQLDVDGVPRYFFVHLQKTAGTALFKRLRHQFGTDAVYPMPQYQGRAETSISVDELVERFAVHRDEIRVVTGHFPLCVTELLDASFSTFTLLREPVERALSFLRHQRKEDPRFASSSLAEIYSDRMCREVLVRNHMVRMLSLTVDEMTDGALTEVVVDDARLERAKDRLANRIDVMGVQEEFEPFCDELERRFGWDLGAPQFANRTQPVEVDPGLRERIAADNEIDAELYRFAVELWAARAASPSH
jgi:Sulfotransferase family